MAERLPSPLAGRKIVVTRAIPQIVELSRELTDRGADPISLPLVSFTGPEDCRPIDTALQQLESFDWTIFTSANAVLAVVQRTKKLGLGQFHLGRPSRIAAVGPATAKEAEKRGISVDYVAKNHSGVALAEELGERVRGKSVLLPRSDRANPDLPAALRRNGARVTEVAAYRTLLPSNLDRKEVNRLVAAGIDAIVFFSPSAVHHFSEIMGREQLPGLQRRIVIAAVGPVTAGALQRAGIERVVQAVDTTATAVVEALEAHFAGAAKLSTVGAKRG